MCQSGYGIDTIVLRTGFFIKVSGQKHALYSLRTGTQGLKPPHYLTTPVEAGWIWVFTKKHPAGQEAVLSKPLPDRRGTIE